MSLYEKLKLYGENPRKPYHMPGHKFGNNISFIDDVLKYDITEIYGFDSLQNPDDIIFESEKLLSKTFKSDRSFFLVNGSSCGIIAAVLSTVKTGDTIITARNVHKSFYSGLIFSGATPYYIYPRTIDFLGIQGGISPDDVKLAIENCPSAKALFIVSPTYEGFTSDIEKIAEIVHSNDMILVVDEAHGAHFGFSEGFPKSAITLGADIVIQSLHKTLPSMTQTSVLHVKGNRVDLDFLKSNINMVHSTSPSYILMASIDNCRRIIDTRGKELFQNYEKNLKTFMKNCEKLENISLIDKSFVGEYAIKGFDMGKLSFYSKNKDISGSFIKGFLREDYNIELEMCGINHALAMTSISDGDFSDLEEAIFALDKKISDFRDRELKGIKFSFIKPDIVLNPRESHFSAKKRCLLSETSGKISGGFLMPYPPGIAIVAPGERITDEIISRVKLYRDNGIQIIGLKGDNSLPVLD